MIDDLGADVTEWSKGQRVGVGYHGGQDNTCLECRRGRFLYCRHPRFAGFSYDGGYQQYMVTPVEALAAIPNTLSAAEAAPLLCAGVTTFNALRRSGASPDSLVAVQGVGGLGILRGVAQKYRVRCLSHCEIAPAKSAEVFSSPPWAAA